MCRVEVIGLRGIPVVREGDDLAELIVSAANKAGAGIREGDILVVSQVIVSKAEGRVARLQEVEPSRLAITVAERFGKDPRHVELILREARRIVRMSRGIIITETHGGHICANSGVDLSNVGAGLAALLPRDPDGSARRLREAVRRITGVDVAVIISDTHGRPLRRGAINVAIGCSGLEPLLDLRGRRDLHGRVLRSKIICVADELASAAELVMGQADEGVPAAIIRGYRYVRGESPASVIPRSEEDDIFL